MVGRPGRARGARAVGVRPATLGRCCQVFARSVGALPGDATRVGRDPKRRACLSAARSVTVRAECSDRLLAPVHQAGVEQELGFIEQHHRIVHRIEMLPQNQRMQ